MSGQCCPSDRTCASLCWSECPEQARSRAPAGRRGRWRGGSWFDHGPTVCWPLLLSKQELVVVWWRIILMDSNIALLLCSTLLHYPAQVNYLKHFKMAEQLFVCEVVPGHDETLARFTPHVTEAVVTEVGQPRSHADVHAAIRPMPAISTQTDSWIFISYTQHKWWKTSDSICFYLSGEWCQKKIILSD